MTRNEDRRWPVMRWMTTRILRDRLERMYGTRSLWLAVVVTAVPLVLIAACVLMLFGLFLPWAASLGQH
jgi:phosphotransferase system  glucose/maltose/N-acetylglucosamine-specific IIC component